jgi:hypothetical protein
MRIRWHHGFLNPRDGEAEISESRAAVAALIGELFPHLAPVRVQHVSFVPKGDGRRAQVNLMSFGPFGDVERDAAPT